jgi:hypothetical protein
MATGTGKTRLSLALMYELLRRKRFRRILFLVDRNALGRQTLDAMSTTDTVGFLKFDQVFPVADLARKFPDATDRVQVATVQAMIRRIFEDPDATRPTPGTYDLIVVDEAHRGYTLDAELREDDLGLRNLDDYLSAYRRVLDYFDATRIALTATPALHTREIFGSAVFRYGYRQAVIDGYLIDHRPPRRITTALSQTGISFEQGEEVNILDPRTGQIDLFNSTIRSTLKSPSSTRKSTHAPSIVRSPMPSPASARRASAARRCFSPHATTTRTFQYDLKPGTVPTDHSVRSDNCKCIIHLGKQPADASDISLSIDPNGSLLGLARRSTLICCRSTTISASSVTRGRSRSTVVPKISLHKKHRAAASPESINRQRIGFTIGTGRP